ncbi:asparagine synthetase B [Natrarchaeobius halalkaliphilus]|uniref:Putative asparagine synthetase [glutamine-hydrolyzing] n=1 Tax=Natrarchaeobius halalkaliphilus TaxID=1679091 RepID=A0A3N6NX68_9EURY|nr:asparagine synthase-related protein [Natrarchaeobius halalkaliphilus]RQG89229.1 asparagine synthetase B [Natrarchaeobius halalkaliphilus]
MSAIVGLFDRTDGRVDVETVVPMHDRLSHRGADGGGRWADDCVGLGHQLLATTPEAAFDDQPARDGRLVVTADARLDNRSELLDALPVSKPPATIPDSELLRSAYRRWGERCVEQLVGAFAFAIWDIENRSLFCARDHVGVKPFYYCLTDELFAFATELKGLFPVPGVGAIDETKIGDFLVGSFDDETRSFYESIERLPPAHAMTVGTESGDVDVRRYWDLDPTRTITLESDAAYERRFRELLEDAVRCRLRTDGTVGSDLSGGLDSSSVTVVARDLLDAEIERNGGVSRSLHTFSNVYEDAPSSDERDFIETVIDRFEITPHYIFDGAGALVDYETMWSYFDRPPHNTLHFARWEKTKRASEIGVDVMLGGELGDSAVGYGLGLLPQLLRTGRFRHLHRELSSMGTLVGAPVRHLLVRHALFPLIPDPIRRQYRRLRGRPVLEEASNPTLDPEFVDRIGLRARSRRHATTSTAIRRIDREWQYRSITSGMNAANFETSDLIAGTFGIEPRYPFTDRRLLEFSLAIPPTQRLADGMTRSILRRSVSDLLPAKIRDRPWKTMMNEAFYDALATEDARLRTLVTDPGPLEEYLDVTAMAASLERFEAAPASRDARALWRALSLAAWLENHS